MILASSSVTKLTPLGLRLFALDGSSFSEFRLLSETEVHELIKSSTKTTCSLDPIPTKLFTECLDVLPPPITKLINLSLESGYFPPI